MKKSLLSKETQPSLNFYLLKNKGISYKTKQNPFCPFLEGETYNKKKHSYMNIRNSLMIVKLSSQQALGSVGFTENCKTVTAILFSWL